MDIAKAIERIRPGAEFNIRDGKIEWLDSKQTEPNVKEIQACIDECSYIEQRAREYPSVEDQLDAIWKGGSEAELMKQKIEAVKAKYPRP